MPISLFDVAGPIMIGPSSSHTAGACKIGQMARALFNGSPTQVDFYLYGSFATVYLGHATDRALLAGVMKFMTSDPRLKDSLQIAKDRGLRARFIPIEETTPEHHPNTVRIILKNRKQALSVVGSSVGGGQVKLTHINNIPIDLEASVGRFFSLLISHNDQAGVLNPIYGQLIDWNIPIARKETQKIGSYALTLLNIEGSFLRLPQVLALEKFPGIHFVRALTKLLKV
ncbi:L-serine ammonia-lyase, iron-sulfur-dependent, subunit beta [Candidatus Peregrinibacteria bacterium]|nr:L-serine ammonia-lyase, iron-sulfur-dependent, subunit beta [Candidatus Peregrinibacteria bacterium]